MALLIKTDGTEEKVEPKNGTDFSLEELQGFIGGLIEIVRATKNRILVVDDEGLFKEKEINWVASHYARTFIVGDALLCTNEEVR